MTKVVYNGCYGGFDLSRAAVMRYAELAGFEVWPDVENSLVTTYWRVPPHERPPTPPMIERMTDASRAYSAAYSKHVFHPREIERTDPHLVQVVEELGREAGGRFGSLCVAEIASGTRYRITEYDGYESVETETDIDWSAP